MTSIGRAHDLLCTLAPRFCIGVLTHGRIREQIREALRACGRDRPQRRCPLHPVLVCWLVLALPFHRTLSIANVLLTLVDTWRLRHPRLPLRVVTDGALAHARKRLGVAPLRQLFEAVAKDVCPAPSFHGRRVWAVDACTSTVPDRPENEAVFGRHRASHGRSAFPQFTTVVLASTRTHEVRAADWIAHHRSEREVAWRFLPHLGKGDLLLLDRGFFSVYYFSALLDRGADFLARSKANIRPIRKQRRGCGDYDVVLLSRWAPPHLRGPKRGGKAVTLRARLLEYTLDGKETIRLLTSITDRRIRPRKLIALYHERWDVELGFDEIKTHLAAPAQGTLRTVYRGRTPTMVEQELWATLTVYTIIRGLMAQAARAHAIDPRRISFVDALTVIRLAAAQAVPRTPRRRLAHYRRLLKDLAACARKRWRRPRRAPRVLRIKILGYPHKKPEHHSEPVDFLENLRLGAAS